MSPAIDAALMERALSVAERGLGRTSPNPIVGAVVVSETGVVVGQGAHLGAGGPHAEVHALSQAGTQSQGGTLYTTLEPCVHQGRTGPCTDRIIAAGVRRVVSAIMDVNPRVSGRGLKMLREHDIDVVEGVGRDAARLQHAPYFKWMTTGRPFVIAKAAISADGYVGRADRRVQLTGPVADRFLHRQRAEVDAIAVGSETVLVDDPLLTPRGAYRYRPLTRVIFDWRGRVAASARVFSTLETGPVIMVVTAEVAAQSPARLEELSARGVTVDVYDQRDIDAVLERLGRREVVSLLVEGGPGLHRAFVEAGAVDRVQLVVTPHMLAGGVPVGLSEPQGTRRTRPLGDDLLVECDVHGTDRGNRTD